MREEEKRRRLRELAETCRSMRLDGYGCIGDFHNGIYECDHVSPWTRSGDNVNAEIMVVGQDWSSADRLCNPTPDMDAANLGYTPNLPTNRNLDDLLWRHFGKRREDCYLTNLFPFVKPGGMSKNIAMKDLQVCAQQFTVEEIRIVNPRLVICLGLRSYVALMRTQGLSGWPKLEAAIRRSPFPIGNAAIHCVAHTGARGMNNRGRNKVENDWRRLAERYPTVVGAT